MRRHALAFVMAIVPAAYAQDLATPVTFTTRAAPAERVLVELGKAAGMKLETAPQTANEVLVLSVKGMPIGQVLDRIALVTSGEWKQEGDVYRLVANQGVRNREAVEEQTLRTNAIRSSLAKEAKEVLEAEQAARQPAKDGAKGNAKAAQARMAFGLGGDDHNLTKIVVGLDPALLGAMAPSDRLVFSSNPNRMQRALPANAMSLVQDLVASHNKQLAGQPKNIDEEPEMEKMPAFVKTMMRNMTQPVKSVGKVLLVVSRMGFGPFQSLQAELRVYDAEGKVALSRPTMIQTNDIASEMEDIEAAFEGTASPAKAKPKAEAKSTEIPLSPDTKALLEAFKGQNQGTQIGMKIPADVRAKLFRPDLYDPLSFLATDSLLALATKRGKPLIACVPDDLNTSFTDLMFNRKPTLEKFEEELQKADDAKIVPDDAFLLVKPAQPNSARALRTERTSLAALLGAVVSKGAPSLDDIAAYALKNPSPMDGGIGQVYVTFFVPGAIQQGLEGVTNWEMLRFYGQLNSTARQTLAQGGRLSIGSLTPGLQASLRRMAFGSNALLEVETGKPKGDDELPGFMRMFGMMGGGGDYRQEPTEAMPTGLPAQGYVELKLSTEPIAMPVPPEGQTVSGMMGVLGPTEMAMFKMFKDEPAYAAMSSYLPSLDRMRVGDRSTYAFRFTLAPQVYMTQNLADNRVPQNGAIVAYANLPADFQKRIAAKLIEVKKSPLGSLGGLMGGGRVTPP